MQDVVFLRLLQTVTLAPTNSVDTIAKANKVFIRSVDPNFVALGTDVPSHDTLKTVITVYEVTRIGDRISLFDLLPTKLRSLCLSQGQIIEFARTHGELLQQDGDITFFFFEVNEKLFVAYVIADVDYGGTLAINLFPFSRNRIWPLGRRRRLVVPGQILRVSW